MRPLYKIVMLFACVACCASASAQIRTVTFTGRDRTNQYHIPLSQVTVFNLDQLWEEVLYYPDTVLVLGTVGLEDYESRQGVQLMQNVPNPFDGTTEFALQLPDGGDVFLEIYDITGKLAVAERFTALPVGTHLFQATLSSPQTYLLSAKVDNGKMTIKMVNEGHGAGNTIHHLGMTDKNGDFTLYLKNEKASSSYPFHLGDEMQYEGFALLDGTQWESAVVTQPQVYNDTVPLLFDVTVPTVQTSPVADITANTVVCGGNVTADGNSPVTARGVCWSTSHNPTVNDSLTTNSSGTGTFTSSVTGLTPNTTYYVRAYATNSVGTGYGEEQMFTTLCNVVNVSITGNTTINYGQSTTIMASGANSYHWSTNATTSSITVSPTSNTTYTVTGTNSYGCTATASVTVTVNPILPTVATNNVSNIQSTTASCGGDVSSDGGASVTARGVCWSTSQNPTVNDSHTTDGSSTGAFISSITGLSPNTTYYLRAYATNSVGTAYGEERMFTTMCNVVNVSITGNTTIYYGESTTLMASGANSYHWSTNANTSNVTVNPTVTTSYTVTGTNNYGCTATASITVTVNPILPTVATNNVSNIQATTASCGGNVSSDGGAPVTARGVCWSTSHNPMVNDSLTTNGSGTGTFTSSITGLTPNTTYYVCAYATNIAGTAYGEEQMFTTLCNVVNVSITGNTTINYGESTTLMASGANSYHWSTNANTSSISVTPASTTTYTVTGTNSYGCTATASVTVTVNPILPTVATNNVSNIQAATALCGGNVSSHGGAIVTARGVCWSTSQNPTVNDSHTTDGSGTGTFSSSITGLSPNTTYYVRAYATNSVGTAYGEERMFTTQCNVVNVSITGNTTINYGQSTTIMASGANSYHWSTNANTSSISVTPISTTTYTVTGTNSYGCTATASVTVTVNFLAPTVTTNNVTDVSQMSAICGGNVTFDGGKAVTARGVCWNTSPNPTVGNSHTEDGNGLGSFASSITGLNPNTTYYVRAYAINSVGMAYGVQKTFTTSCNTVAVSISGNTIIDYGQSTTLTASGANSYRWSNNATTTNITVSPTSTTTYTVTGTNSYGCTATASVTVTVNPIAPTVTTNMVSNIDSVSALCGGNVTSDGGATVTERGVCWSTSPNPTVNDGHTTNGTGIGSFISHITGLTVVTTYYVRAYAINSVDTAYGQQVEFTTANFACGSIIVDYDGNTYNTVQIGGQCWMKENLRTAHYADGTPVEGYVQGNNVSSVPAYGYSYNWTATMNGASFSDATPSGVQGICPNGWHVPSNAEWCQLVDYMSAQSQYWCGGESRNIAKALADTAGWNVSAKTCAVGNNPSTNNVSGFCAMPAGYNGGDYNNNFSLGDFATFWSTTGYPEDSGVQAWYFKINYNDSMVVRDHYYNYAGDFFKHNFYYSARCIRNEITSQYFPTVSTSSVSNITSTTATCGGNVTAPEGVSVTARGVCWSLLPNPTIADKHSVAGIGAGSFTSNIDGLVSNRTYFVRAYASNSFGTVYGNEVSVTTTAYLNGDSLSCPGLPILTDVDGNVYNTVQIGGQCWMRENLRTTKYADGTVIAEGSDTSSTIAFRYYPEGISSLKQSYGLLYNWPAVMHESSSSDATPSGVLGVCPTGWHVPSEEEWTLFDNYVRSQSQYGCVCDDSWLFGNYYAKALAATEGWEIDSYNYCPCRPGNYDQGSNNATGFGALPAGGVYRTYEYGNDYWEFGDRAIFWSATEYSHNYSFVRWMDYTNSSLYSDKYGKSKAYSVRCLSDVSFATSPTVQTSAVSNVTNNTASCGGNVTDDGGAVVTERGVCWSTSPNPTVSGSHTTDGGGTGAFTSSLTGLTPNTTYYVRAYAINSVDTAYGAQQSFVTIVPDGDPCPGTPTVSDIDGNTYNTVKIGQQCWMKENLRTTKYADGTNIPAGGDNNSFTLPYYYDYGNSNIPLAERGLLYNWPAVMHGANSSEGNPSNVQGVCPVGWHVPSDAEWTQLTDYVSSQSEYLCDDNNTRIAKALAATNRWNSGSTTCSVGYNQTSNNATGFSAIPSGQYNAYGSWFTNSRYGTYFWSATDTSYFEAWIRCLIATDVKVYHSSKDKNNGCSVRCLRDSIVTEVQLSLPIVTSDSATLVNSSSAYSGGNVISGGGGIVTDRGVCWSISQNPTIDNNHYSSGRGGGAFTTIITGLSPSTTYYVRAYATNYAGTAYGEQRSFTTMASENTLCPGTIADIDGNIYTTVRIGGQCWMRENLRTTKYADGTDIIQENSGYDTSSVGWYYRSGDFLNNPYLGLEYNWSAVMHGAASSDATPSGVQGICPDGWHVPSDAEWTQLFQYVGNQSQYLCDNNSNNIAKALASSTGWNYSANTCAVGNMPSNNNSTGFSALPNYNDDSRHYAYFWSATKTSGSEPKIRYLVSDFEGVCSNIILNGYSCPVRCLFNEDQSQYFPSVSTNAVNSVTSTTAVCGGTVTSTGIVSVTDRGVCWSILHNPTIAENHAPNGSGTGSFTGSISGLSTNTTYYLRAYATTIYGTVYGNEVQFTTPVNFSGDEYSCPNAPVLTDADGNIYNTLLLGGQCWMRENLRTTKYANGSSVAQGNMQGIDYSDTTGYWYYPVNDSSNKYTYGLLYNWYAVMNGSSSSTTNPSGVQGICPTGWHVPSPAEWSQLTDYISSQSQYWCGGDSNNIAKALASTAGWFMNDRYAQECSASNIPGNNNATGFGVLPAGAFFGGEFNNYAYEALYWSSTQYDDDYACYWGFAYMQSRFFGDNISRWNKKYGFSVRCLCDAATAVIDSKSCPAAPTVTDHEGNVYATVQIGSQCWMRDNLRTTTSPSTGTYLIPAVGTTYTYTGKQARWYNNDSTTYAPMNYGLLYNWNAAVDTFNTAYGETSVNSTTSNAVSVSFTGHRRGICPAGWHLPSDAEWTQLTTYVGSQSEYTCGGNSSYIAKALASTEGWYSSSNECAVGNGQASNNAAGFSAVPAGFCGSSLFADAGYYANFWSSSQASDAHYRYLFYDFANVYSSGSKIYGFSVRCLRDADIAVVDSKSCPAAPTVTDHEGNVYATVQIGNQCWMRDNLRTTTSPSTGTYLIPAAGTTYTYTGKQARWYNDDSTTYAPMNYGLLYNWNAAVDTFNTAYGETSVNTSSSYAVSVTFTGHRRGICPAGWHLPSDAEWNLMEATVSGSDWQASYETTYGYRGIHAGKLAGGDNWYSSSTSGAPGDYSNADRNVSGFSAVPAGDCGGSSFGNAGYYTYFWSSSQIGSTNAYARNLNYYSANVNRNSYNKYYDHSVRCLRDGAGNPPNAPTGVSATLSGTQIQVSWNSVSNATSYKVYRSSSVNGSYTLIGSPTSNYYNDANPLTGYNYYKVKAVNSTGESAYSSVASCNYAAVSHTISISLITDRYGSDITWQVKDVSTNTILASGGPYSDLSSNGTTIQDIPTIYVDGTGCYVFIINDSYGDGLCCSSGNGSYSVSYDGVVIGSGGNAFSQETYYLNCPNVDDKSCPAAPTVTDHEGNVYATVQIGSQCWMRDNLRTTTSPSTGTYLIPAAGTGRTYTGKQARWYNNDSTTYAPMNYGLLYNWNAAVDTFNTAYGETSVNDTSGNAVSVFFTGHRRGICPSGWHLPSDAEWTQLTNYVKTQSEYICGDTNINIAKALASETGWNSYSGECYPGARGVYANNATGFSAVPAGCCYGSSFVGAGYNADFWSSTQYSSDGAYDRSLVYYGACVGRYFYDEDGGFSVRCLRD